MKKALELLAAVSILVLAMGVACACAEDDMRKIFEPQTVNSGGFSAEEWISTEKKRALLTVLLATDFYFSEDNSDLMTALVGNTYVSIGVDGTKLGLLYYNEGTAFDVTYSPEEGVASCLGPMNYTEDDLKRVINSMGFLGVEYIENPIETIIETECVILGALSALQEIDAE